MPSSPRDPAPDVLEAKPPVFSPVDAERVAREGFGVEVSEVAPLESERDQNFRLRATDGREVVLKIANPS